MKITIKFLNQMRIIIKFLNQMRIIIKFLNQKKRFQTKNVPKVQKHRFVASLFKKYGWIQLYESSFALLFTIFASFFLLSFMNDPPTFPKPQNEQILDCANIISPRIWDESSRVKANITLNPFLQYPHGIAQSLFYMSVTSPNSELFYFQPNYWDWEEKNKSLSFCLLQTINGPLHVNLYCQNNVIKEYEFVLDSVSIYPVGWTFIESRYDMIGTIHDFCIQNRSILFSTSLKKAYFNPIKVGHNHYINIYPESSQLHDIVYRNNSILIEEPVLFLSTSNPDPTKIPSPSLLLLDFALPLWAYISTHSHNESYRFMLIRNELYLKPLAELLMGPHFYYNSSLFPARYNQLITSGDRFIDNFFTYNYSQIIRNNNNTIDNNTIDNNTIDNNIINDNINQELKNASGCIREGIFLKTTGSIPYSIHSSQMPNTINGELANMYEWISSYSDSIIPSFRKRFTNNSIKRGRIVLSKTIQKICPEEYILSLIKGIPEINDIRNEIEVKTINEDMTLIEIANIVSTADLYISGDLSEYIYGVFLNTGASFVEFQRNGAECSHLGSKFARLGHAKYYSLFDKEDCLIQNFQEYLDTNHGYSVLDDELVKSTLVRALLHQ